MDYIFTCFNKDCRQMLRLDLPEDKIQEAFTRARNLNWQISKIPYVHNGAPKSWHKCFCPEHNVSDEKLNAGCK